MSHISGTLYLLPLSTVVIRFLATSARHWYVPLFTKNLIKRVRSSHQRCFAKIGLLRNFTKFTGKYLCQSLFFNKVALACNFIEKETPAQVFSCEFCEISKNTFFAEHLWKTASEESSLSNEGLTNLFSS